MLLIGDVHKAMGEYFNLIEGEKDSIQLGDFLCGDEFFEPYLRQGHMFIRGNHDPVEQCGRLTENYIPAGSMYKGLFCIGGADHYPGRPGEPAVLVDFDDVRREYLEAKPQIVVTHTCPEIAGDVLTYGAYTSMPMEAFLQSLWEEHRPDLWVFGHWHMSRAFSLGGTEFRCLNTLEGFVI